MVNNLEQVQCHEGSAWFWKLFGGAIMGIISILLLAHITNINSNIDRSFLSLRGEIKDLFIVIDSQKERLVTLEQNREQSKEKTASLEKTLMQLQLSMEEVKQKAAANDAQFVALKDEIKTLQEWNKEANRQLQDIREKLVADDATKKANELQSKK